MTTITGLILAGGRATRMGGDDKGLLEIAGKPLVERITEQLAPQVDTVLINANRNLTEYQKLGYTVVSDSMADFQGPLAGMLSGLGVVDTEWMLTTPCDGPFMDANYANRMLKAANSDDSPLVVAKDADRIQPVYCLVHKSLADSLQSFLESGDRKIDRWFSRHPYTTVLFDGTPSMFTNVNTPEDLAEVSALL